MVEGFKEARSTNTDNTDDDGDDNDDYDDDDDDDDDGANRLGSQVVGFKEARSTNQTWLPLPTRSDTGEDAPLSASSSPF